MKVLGIKVTAWRGRMATRDHQVKSLLTDAKRARTIRYANFGKTHDVNAATLKGKTVTVGADKVVVA